MFVLKDVIYKNILRIPELEIEAGGITCLFGPSGCGKTTLLRMLNGMISPDSGRILFQGEDLAHADLVELRRRVVMLGQQSTVFPGSVRENLNIAAEFQELPPFPDQTLSSILEQVGLGNKALDNDPELYSGGEKQRLALARVLLLQPPVLLLDEPGSALDAATETAVMDLIAADLNSRKASCVLVTHSEEMARRYSRRIIRMEAGTVLRVETPVKAGSAAGTLNIPEEADS
ncbi:ABC transporter ATP-binding protein [Bacilliculturomica massiliensis]|uniref:ABC transporter ATP-binding protein n=1 Tax=Bacilliculturomica massiliensis TaxID=1917867 RepID=UPI001030D169|nr:ATP-binding cassette domain-containing protein [Bacilliculturomica massiliensis]